MINMENINEHTLQFQFLGQNCFLITYKNINILTDPFYNMQLEKSSFDITQQKIDYILITHAHADHTADVQEVLEHHPEAILIGQPEVCAYFSHEKFIDLNFGGSCVVHGLKIAMVPASHTSSFPDGRYGGEPAGYVLSSGDHHIYFAGDTGIMSDMALLPQLFGNIAAAVLPVGGHYTMDASQAAFAAAELIKTQKVVGCHFDTFPPISIDHGEALEAFNKRNIECILPAVGQIIQL